MRLLYNFCSILWAKYYLIKKNFLIGLIITLSVYLALSVILDILFISNLNVLFKLGVNGIAISNIIINGIMFVSTFIILIKKN